MHPLNINLQEGFEDDTVVIRVNGAEVLHQQHVKTRQQIGFAAETTATVPAGTVALEIALPVKGITGNIDIDMQAPMWAGVSLDSGSVLQFKISQTPFGYV